MNDIFGPGANVENRVLKDYKILNERIEGCKKIGYAIVLTSGTFDLLHIGHCRYFENARKAAMEKLKIDSGRVILVVGIDSDEKVKKKKGPNRPIVPEKERCEMICHTRHVDLVMVKQEKDPHWQLIKTVCPDILIISETSKENYDKEKITELKQYCGNVVKLKAQAETSTSAKIRLLHVNIAEKFKEKYQRFSENVKEKLDEFSKSINEMTPDK
jgi:D-glycero-beta-D-manno-heptose 1-phosphate adenylyltransferase